MAKKKGCIYYAGVLGCAPVMVYFAVIAWLVIFGVDVTGDEETQARATQQKRDEAARLYGDATEPFEGPEDTIPAAQIDSATYLPEMVNTDFVWSVRDVPNTRKQSNYIHVSDPNNIIGEAFCDSLNYLLSDIQQLSDVFVVALYDIDEDYMNFAHNLLCYWGVGEKGKDNGVLVLLKVGGGTGERHIYIATGYGMEGVLPDILCHHITETYAIPYFKEGDYPRGTLEAMKEVVRAIKANPEELEEMIAEAKDDIDTTWLGFGLLGIGCVPGVLCRRRLKRVRAQALKDSYNKNDALYIEAKKLQTNSTMGLLGLGGLALACPLSIASILQYRRAAKKARCADRVCPKCGKTMRRLSEEEEDAYMSKIQIHEEKSGSRDYDVWLCECGNTRKECYDSTNSSIYTTCGKCGAHLMRQVKRRTLVSATYSSSGTDLVTYECEACKHRMEETVTVPKKVRASSSSGGGSSYSGGGGSFGGGSSGGGGGGSSW